MAALVILAVLVLAALAAEHIVIEVQVVLEGIRHQHVVHVLSQVHSHVDLVAELVFFLFIEIALLGCNTVGEHVEEGVGLDGLDDGACLIGLLVLLLLLDLLLGRVLRLVRPRNRRPLDPLHLVLRVRLVHNSKGKHFLGEVLVLAEVELDGE